VGRDGDGDAGVIEAEAEADDAPPTSPVLLTALSWDHCETSIEIDCQGVVALDNEDMLARFFESKCFNDFVVGTDDDRFYSSIKIDARIKDDLQVVKRKWECCLREILHTIVASASPEKPLKISVCKYSDRGYKIKGFWISGGRRSKEVEDVILTHNTYKACLHDCPSLLRDFVCWLHSCGYLLNAPTTPFRGVVNICTVDIPW
jgi:hypothetical protein